jgi:hypothetical protein
LLPLVDTPLRLSGRRVHGDLLVVAASHGGRRVAILAGSDGLFRWHLIEEETGEIEHSSTSGYVSRIRAQRDLLEFGTLLYQLGYVDEKASPIERIREFNQRGGSFSSDESAPSLSEVRKEGAEATREAERQKRRAYDESY